MEELNKQKHHQQQQLSEYNNTKDENDENKT